MYLPGFIQASGQHCTDTNKMSTHFDINGNPQCQHLFHLKLNNLLIFRTAAKTIVRTSPVSGLKEQTGEGVKPNTDCAETLKCFLGEQMAERFKASMYAPQLWRSFALVKGLWKSMHMVLCRAHKLCIFSQWGASQQTRCLCVQF